MSQSPGRTKLDDDVEDQANGENRSTATLVGAYLLDNVFGVRSAHMRQKTLDVPEGCSVSHTSKGQAYIVKDNERDVDAMNEHIRPGATTSFRASFGRLAERFGEGVYQYFDFIVFLCITNAVMLAYGVVNMIPHFVFDDFDKSRLQENFYVSTYSAKSFKYWWWSYVIFSAMILFTFGPALGLRISMRFKRKNIPDTEDQIDASAADLIKDRSGLPKNPETKQIKRFVLSYFLFIVLLAVSGMLSLGFVAAQFYAWNNSFAASLLVSVVVTVLNAIWTEVCTGLTLIEAHYTWSGFKNHHTLKLFIWKILNVSLMFLGQWLASRCYLKEIPIWAWIFNITNKGGLLDAPGAPQSVAIPMAFPPDAPPDFAFPVAAPAAAVCNTSCEIKGLGNQFLTLLIVDLLLSNAIRLFWPWFGWKLYGWCTRKHTSVESEDGRIDFDIAINYLDLLYRQFVIYLGTPFVPFLPLLGLVVNLVQIPVDKWRLLKYCRTPPRLTGSMKHFLVFFLFISSVVSIAVFPYGTGWVLSSYTLSSSCPDTIFGKNSNATII